MSEDKLEEKLYLVTYEDKIEPLYSRNTVVQPATSHGDAKRRFLDEQSEGYDIILGVKEFTIPGYKITLERIVEEPDSQE